MSHKNKTYWKGIEEKENTVEFQKSLENEFPEPPSTDKRAGDGDHRFSRRSFLKAAGFSMAGTFLASCARGPVEKAIPLLIRPEEVIPGKAYWYASTCAGCNANCGILVKNRDGRPIKIEGNPDHPLSKGGICAVGQASVLGLYDSKRLAKPQINGKEAEWTEVDSKISKQIEKIRENVYLLTGTISSPSKKALIDKFLNRFQNSAHVEYDPFSYSAILDSHESTHGKRALPHYMFHNAEVIASFDADFLGTWISPVEFTKDYVNGRTLKGENIKLSRHIHFEGRMSLTGSNADKRVKVSPVESNAFIIKLAENLAAKVGRNMPKVSNSSIKIDEKTLQEITNELWHSRGKSLVVSGSNDVKIQRLINLINDILGNYGNTVDIQQNSNQYKGNDKAVKQLIDKMKAGEVKALFIADVNPAYSLPNSPEFIEAFKNVPLTIAFASHLTETSELAHYVCPTPHALEAWNDIENVNGIFSMMQPTIPAMGDTRSLRECLYGWMGSPKNDHAIIQEYWQKNIFTRQNKEASFQDFWDKAVHDGVATVNVQANAAKSFRFKTNEKIELTNNPDENSYALVLYQKIGMLDGAHAHNPWLHELPDPITKVVWDNYVCFSPNTAKKLGVEQGDVVKVAAENTDLELPVLVQASQHDRVVAIAVGYGRKGTDRFSEIGPQWLQSKLTVEKVETVGKNGFILATQNSENIIFENTISISPANKKVDLALTQTHHTITVPKKLGGERRHMVRETTLASYQKDPASGNHFEHEELQLWAKDHKYENRHWGMAIDLNRCTGCSACVISCQAENNISVVGKDEVYRRRDMHWMRIDRYYSGEEEDVDTMHQPVMCQHCDHAPCEGVCPVLATVHSDEGINQQIYNRCVGTRYCANNCPYKVRRFNWFDYRKEDERENMALNPDITARTRGVMEKCSLCVQRIQEAKLNAKQEGKALADGDIKLACEQSCPADAIVFGDMNDPESRISKLIADPRHYHMLEEMNFRPTVGYLTKVRNRDEEEDHSA